MNFNFKIVEIELGPRASIYTISIDGKEKTELELFLSNVGQEINEIEDSKERNKLKEALDFIVNRLKNTIPQKGCLDYYFEYDGKSTDVVEKIKQSLLRLYCLRFGKLLIIVGNGGIKPENIRTTQGKKDLDKAVKNLQYINDKIESAQKIGRFSFDDTGIITETSKIKFDWNE